MKNSLYADQAARIKKLTGYDCRVLTDAQMDDIGMAAERADLDFDWSKAKNEQACEERAKRISAAKYNIKSVTGESKPLLRDVMGAYVGGFYEDYKPTFKQD